MENMKRANKVTVAFVGEGVARATFYKTHEKLVEVLSTDPAVITGGFQFPESIPATETTEAIEVSSADKLKSFKEFVIANATMFNVYYDAVDRRDETNKFPSKYTEALLIEYGNTMVINKLNDILPSIQKFAEKSAESGAMTLAEGTVIEAEVGIGQISVDETYPDGHLKYASATYPVTLTIGEVSAVTDVKVSLVSGQLKKPTEFGTGVFTITGVKTRLLEAGVLVEPIKKVKEKAEDTEGEVVEGEASGEVAAATDDASKPKRSRKISEDAPTE